MMIGILFFAFHAATILFIVSPTFWLHCTLKAGISLFTDAAHRGYVANISYAVNAFFLWRRLLLR